MNQVVVIAHQRIGAAQPPVTAAMEKESPDPAIFRHFLGTSEVITIDLMRRAGLFEEAKQVATSIDTSEIDETIAKVITFAIHLIDQRDNGVYTIQQALE